MRRLVGTPRPGDQSSGLIAHRLDHVVDLLLESRALFRRSGISGQASRSGEGMTARPVYMASVDDLLAFCRDFGQDPSLWGETIELRRVPPAATDH